MLFLDPGRIRSLQHYKLSVPAGSARNSLPGVEANPFVKVGDRISRAQSDGDRLGYILATGADPHEARARANTAEKLIRFDIAADD